MKTERTQPFLRWAGGKKWLIPIVTCLTEGLDYKNYYEPFLGGASIFLSLEINKHAYLSDLNGELIDTYIAVRDDPEEVIAFMQGMSNTEEEYYRIRAMTSDNIYERAARFIYLNQTSFNGIYRVNLKGEYNVPYGFRKFNYDYSRVLSASEKLQRARLANEDFASKKYRIKERDLVFLDPPYTVSHNNNGFVKYNQKIFSLEDQYRLSRFIDYIANKGAYFILTNAAHDKVKDIFYHDCAMLEVSRNSLIGGKNAARKKVSEYVFTNIPEAETKVNL